MSRERKATRAVGKANLHRRQMASRLPFRRTAGLPSQGVRAPMFGGIGQFFLFPAAVHSASSHGGMRSLAWPKRKVLGGTATVAMCSLRSARDGG